MSNSTSFNWGKSIVNAIPYISVALGLCFFTISVFVTFENQNWKIFWGGLGKTILAGGIFALLLKTIQFMGVFKKELTDLIYEQRFLENRKDLPQVWERVSRVMFKNKFPKISKNVTQDISQLYFPMDHVLYYDNYEQTLRIELIDPNTETIRVEQSSEFTIYPKDDKTFTLSTRNTLVFNESKDEVKINLKSFYINDREVKPNITQKVEETCVRTLTTIELGGFDSYKIENVFEKEYSLKYDRVIGMKKPYLINNFKLKIFIKGNLKVNFLDAGTLHEYKKASISNNEYQEYISKGMIYPKQGYLLVVEKIS